MDAGATTIDRDAPLFASGMSSRAERNVPLLPTVSVLLLLAVSIQGIVILRAVVPALDAVRYVAEAKHIASSGIAGAVLRSVDDAPLYPATIAAIYEALDPWLATRRDGWALAAQIASALALVLAAPFVFAFSSQMVDRRAAFVAALLFCVLPEFARLGGDAIGDSVGLLFFAIALTCALVFQKSVQAKTVCATAGLSEVGWKFQISHEVAGHTAPSRRQFPDSLGLPSSGDEANDSNEQEPIHQRSWSRLYYLLPILAGIATATALLVGKEAIVLPAVIGAMSIRPKWRSTAILTLVGFVLTIGTWYAAGQFFSAPQALDHSTATTTHTPLPVKESSTSIRFHGYTAAIMAAARALPRLLHYVLLPLAVWGIIADLGSRRENCDVTRFVLLFFALYLGAAVFYAARAGYLEPRHLAPVALVLLPWSAAGAIAAGQLLARASTNRQASQILAGSVAALIIAACVLQATKPLHGRRTPHRDAAQWLAAHADPRDCVLDSRGWTGLLSGLTSYSFRESGAALAQPRLRYLILERHELRYASERSRLLVQFVAECDASPIEFTSPTRDPGQDVLVVRLGPAPRASRLAWDNASNRDGDRRLAP